MDTSEQPHLIEVNPTEFVNWVVGAALGPGLPTQMIDFSARRSKPMIVIAAAPKSGSTFLANVIKRVTNLPNARFTSGYGTNEHDLYLPALYMMNNGGCISRLHMKGTFHNAAILKIFGVKPVIQVRNIEDTIISLADDLREKEQQEKFGSGLNGFSFLWHDHAIANLDEASLIDCLIDLAIPWYVNFYVSWYRLCERNEVDALWVTYEEMIQNKRKTVSEILEFTGFGTDVHIDDTILEERYSKFNKGGHGRGRATLSEAQKARIKRFFSYYPDVDFSKYGLGNPTVPATIGVRAAQSADEMVDTGEEHHKAGRLQEAESCYHKALALDPRHPGALYYLASIAYDDGRLPIAKKFIDLLLMDEPNDAEALHLLGMIAVKEDNLARAAECIKKALLIQPTYVQAHYSLGDVLSRQGDIDAALASFQRAATLNPTFAEAHFAIGNIWQSQNNLDAAILNFQKAIEEKPDFELVYERIGGILFLQEKWDEAIAFYRRAVAELPDSALLHVGLGAAYLLKNQNDAAAVSLERALEIDPNCAMAYGNLGIILIDQGKFSEAEAAFQRTVDLSPQDTRSLSNLSKLLTKAGKPKEAVECLKKVISIAPADAEAHGCLLFLLPYLPESTREEIYAAHVAFGENIEAPLRNSWPPHIKPIDSKKRLRVGFVSGDLCSHPVGHFLEGVLRELRNLDGIDIIVYSASARADAVTERLRAAAHIWSPIFSLSDDAFEQRIRENNIDILVDLSGHTGFNRLLAFARKPAPVQVTWLGYWNTTGLRAIDYILSDRYSIRDGEERFYVEQPWPMPYTRLCFTPPGEKLSIAPLPAISAGYVTFGCFNKLSKMTDHVIAVWSRILKRVPNARLRLKSEPISDPIICESILARFAAQDIAADRLLLEPASPPRDYYLAYNNVDIALDPFPFTGGTTSVDGIWMGVPLITLCGNSIISRQGESILHNLGLPDWIAENEDEYVELAVQRATDLARLAELRGQLRSRLETSPLCDAKLFAQHLEDAFTQMWEKYCESPIEVSR